MTESITKLLLAVLDAARIINISSADAILNAPFGVVEIDDAQEVVRNVALGALRACACNLRRFTVRDKPESASSSSDDSDTEEESNPGTSPHQQSHSALDIHNASAPRAKRARFAHIPRTFRECITSKSYLAEYGYDPSDDSSTRIMHLRKAQADVGFRSIMLSLCRTAPYIAEINQEWGEIMKQDILRLRVNTAFVSR